MQAKDFDTYLCRDDANVLLVCAWEEYLQAQLTLLEEMKRVCWAVAQAGAGYQLRQCSLALVVAEEVSVQPGMQTWVWASMLEEARQ